MKTSALASAPGGIRSVRTLIYSALLLCFSGALQGAFTNFITRSGSSIMDGGASFRFIGANVPEVTHIRTDFDLLDAQRMRFPTCAEIDYLVGVAAQANIKVIRTWCFPSIYDNTKVPHELSYFYTVDGGISVTLNENAFVRFDYLLKVCAAQGVRLQVPFLYQWVWAGSDGKPHRQFKDLVSKILNRTNTLTGVQYKNDKTIYCWESGNEINPPDLWITDLAAHVKSIAGNHLFMDGRDYAQDIYDQYYNDTVLAGDTNIDLVSYHCYAGTGHDNANGWPVATTMANLNTRLAAYNKALDIGEISLLYSVTALDSVLSAIQSNGVQSGSYWSWKGIKSQGGYMQWNGATWGPNDDLKWPGFISPLNGVSTEKAKVDTLVSYHYSIGGNTRPAIPLPSSAHLNPVADVGHISWEPGVGEQTADIERSSDGVNFSVIQSAYETYKSGHAAMFSDLGAVVGNAYYYRIRARNTTGAAPYSNVVGPAAVSHLWLVDELWDTAKMNSSSAGCVITANYDAVTYHCDLAYLSSSGGAQNVVYQVGGNVNQLAVVSSNDTTTLTVEASVNGSSYTPLVMKRTVYPPLHTEFYGHPRILYRSGDVTTGGYRYIRINFGASDVISRVEIAHSGTAAPVPNEYIIDNSDAAFTSVGAWAASTSNSATYGIPHHMNANYLHDGDALAGGTKSATWTSPITTTGTYDVYLRWSGSKSDNSRPTAAPVEVNYFGGITNLTVNQRRNPGAWSLLWTWDFTGGSGDYVKITDADAGYTIADSVRWVKILGYDSFADGNDTGWTKVGGAWNVVVDGGSNAYDQATSSGEALATYGNVAGRDYVYSADVKVTTEASGATGPGLVFRFVDSNNYYMFQLRRPANVVRLWKKQGGVWSQVGSDVPFTSLTNTWYAMRVELAGTSIRCYVDDCKLLDLIDPTFGSGGVGFRTGNVAARIDNVHVK